MTHTKQTVDSYDIIALLDGSLQPVKIEVTVLNESILTSLDLKGYEISDFGDLRNDVVERLQEAGYSVDRMDLGNLK